MIIMIDTNELPRLKSSTPPSGGVSETTIRGLRLSGCPCGAVWLRPQSPVIPVGLLFCAAHFLRRRFCFDLLQTGRGEAVFSASCVTRLSALFCRSG